MSRDEHYPISALALEKIGDILAARKGFNLGVYKDKCIKRRIAVRIRAIHSPSAEEYASLLERDEGEQALLLKVLTIHVSHFFRNPQTYRKLRDQVFPYLFDLCHREGRKTLRVWSVGCACGEEPYSLALIVRDAFPGELERIGCSIHGTDIDAGVLESATRGIYGEDRLAEVPEAMKSRYFARVDGNYQLLPEVRGLVSFERRDVSQVDSYPESDLILCRNVLIYFEREEQKRIINGFADAMQAGGILVLGKSEALLGEIRRRFHAVCPIERIYRRD